MDNKRIPVDGARRHIHKAGSTPLSAAYPFCTLSIILSYLADNQLIERGLKRRELEDARINYTLKNDEMISLWRMTRVEETLKKMGSDVTAPIKPAKELK